MKFINFGKDYEIGIRSVDQQHKEIIDTINYLYDIRTHDKKEILEYFNTLVTQLKTHFESEENLMKENKVVHFISHKLEHDRAYSKYADYYNTYKAGNTEFDPEILVSLKNWIQNHMIRKDMKLKALANFN